MKKTVVGFATSVLIGCILLACGKDTDEDIVKPEDVWNKSRTTNITILSTLSESGLTIGSSNIADITGAINETAHAVTVLDRANVTITGNSQTNPAFAVAAKVNKVPVFVPAYRTAYSYVGNAILINHTYSKMRQRIVADYCHFMEIETKATASIPMKFTTISLVDQKHLEDGVKAMRSALSNSTVNVGIVKRSLLAELQSIISKEITVSYIFEEIENADKQSAYCIFLLTSNKWKLREVTEKNISAKVNRFQLEIESMQ